MHPAAFQWAKENIPPQPARVLEIGGADINCSLRNFFTWSEYLCVDSHPGPGVDVVADFADWAEDDKQYDLVVCFEVFEHTARWRDIIIRARERLAVSGLFIGTCASVGRATHSAWGTPELKPGEWYANVGAQDLAEAFDLSGFTEYTIDCARSGLDLRWKAVRT